MKIKAECSVEGLSGGPVAPFFQDTKGDGKRSTRPANLMAPAVAAPLCAAWK